MPRSSGQQPQDERVAQGLAAQHDRGLVGRSAAVRLPRHEGTAPQTAPGLALGGVDLQPPGEVLLGPAPT